MPRKYFMGLLLIGFLLATLPTPALSQPSFTVGSGFDLFQTIPDLTTFDGNSFFGIPIEGFDFGDGVVGTGGADTIIERTDPATVTGAGQTATIDIELVALQLRSVNLIDDNFHYLTLQTARTAEEEVAQGAGSASTGSMNITFDDQLGGIWSTSFFDVFFDIRTGGLDGVIIGSNSQSMNSSGNIWSRISNPYATLIDGVNNNLIGDNGSDFWTSGIVHGGTHAITQDIPEPGSLALLGLGLVGIALVRIRKKL